MSKLLAFLAFALTVVTYPGVNALMLEAQQPSGPQGIDVSSHQPDVNWPAVKANDATNVGMIRGSYHFATPDSSSGADQANYFLAHGGGWSADGRTLPGALDIEYNPYGPNKCYGLNQGAMVAWIRDFSNTYHDRILRYPVIYTTTDWWKMCTGNNAGFGSTSPLWIAHFASSVGELPAGWGFHTFWQYNDKGSNPGDPDVFNGDSAHLQIFARG